MRSLYSYIITYGQFFLISLSFIFLWKENNAKLILLIILILLFIFLRSWTKIVQEMENIYFIHNYIWKIFSAENRREEK